jgi:exodeoxyribonuclease VII large subunit
MKKPEDLVHQYIQRIDELSLRLSNSYSTQITGLRQHIRQYNAQLISLNPQNIINRGYALVYRHNKILTTVKPVDIGDQILIKLKDGSLNSKVLEKNDE